MEEMGQLQSPAALSQG